MSDNGLLVDDELATDYRNLPESGSAYQADSVEREWREPRYPVARARHTISPLTGDILFTFGPRRVGIISGTCVKIPKQVERFMNGTHPVSK